MLFILDVAIQISIVFLAYVTVPSAMKTGAGEDRGNLEGNKDKYILQLNQIHFAIQKNIFCNLDKYI